MPVTLVSHSAAIGLGVMTEQLMKNIKEIDSLILIDFNDDVQKINFSAFNVLERHHVDNLAPAKKSLKLLAKDKARKFLFIERSRGLAKYSPKESNFLIPMWEQEPLRKELKFHNNLISITRFTSEYLSRLGRQSHYIPWGVEASCFKPVTGYPRKILHNAGGYGGDFRKGTPEAIQIFQRSNIAELGITLTISTFKEPPKELCKLVNSNPNGIIWDYSYKNTIDDIYRGFDLLLYPSRVEGHALPALEAHVRGIPVLCSDQPPINEYQNDIRFRLPIKSRKGKRVYTDIEKGSEVLKSLINIDFTSVSSTFQTEAIEMYNWGRINLEYTKLFSNIK